MAGPLWDDILYRPLLEGFAVEIPTQPPPAHPPVHEFSTLQRKQDDGKCQRQPFWCGVPSLVAFARPGLSACLVALSIAEVLAVSHVGTVAGGFYKALVDSDVQLFRAALARCAFLYTISASIHGLQLWVEELLALHWRSSLVTHAHELYLAAGGLCCHLVATKAGTGNDQNADASGYHAQRREKFQHAHRRDCYGGIPTSSQGNPSMVGAKSCIREGSFDDSRASLSSGVRGPPQIAAACTRGGGAAGYSTRHDRPDRGPQGPRRASVPRVAGRWLRRVFLLNSAYGSRHDSPRVTAAGVSAFAMKTGAMGGPSGLHEALLGEGGLGPGLDHHDDDLVVNSDRLSPVLGNHDRDHDHGRGHRPFSQSSSLFKPTLVDSPPVNSTTGHRASDRPASAPCSDYHADGGPREDADGDAPPLDNPDLRITGDIAAFTTSAAQFLRKAASTPFLIVYYSLLVHRHLGLLGVLPAYGFFLLGVAINWALVAPLARLVAKQESLEGDFRFLHTRVRLLSAEIALQRGGEAEKALLGASLRDVLANQRRLARRHAGLEWVTNMFDYMGAAVNYILLGLSLFLGGHLAAGAGGSSGDAAQLISNISFATLQLVYSFTSLIDLSRLGSDITGYGGRVVALLRRLEAVQPPDLTPGREPDIATGTGCEGARRPDSDVRPASGTWPARDARPGSGTGASHGDGAHPGGGSIRSSNRGSQGGRPQEAASSQEFIEHRLAGDGGREGTGEIVVAGGVGGEHPLRGVSRISTSTSVSTTSTRPRCEDGPVPKPSRIAPAGDRCGRTRGLTTVSTCDDGRSLWRKIRARFRGTIFSADHAAPTTTSAHRAHGSGAQGVARTGQGVFGGCTGATCSVACHGECQVAGLGGAQAPPVWYVASGGRIRGSLSTGLGGFGPNGPSGSSPSSSLDQRVLTGAAGAGPSGPPSAPASISGEPADGVRRVVLNAADGYLERVAVDLESTIGFLDVVQHQQCLGNDADRESGMVTGGGYQPCLAMSAPTVRGASGSAAATALESSPGGKNEPTGGTGGAPRRDVAGDGGNTVSMARTDAIHVGNLACDLPPSTTHTGPKVQPSFGPMQPPAAPRASAVSAQPPGSALAQGTAATAPISRELFFSVLHPLPDDALSILNSVFPFLADQLLDDEGREAGKGVRAQGDDADADPPTELSLGGPPASKSATKAGTESAGASATNLAGREDAVASVAAEAATVTAGASGIAAPAASLRSSRAKMAALQRRLVALPTHQLLTVDISRLGIDWCNDGYAASYVADGSRDRGLVQRDGCSSGCSLGCDGRSLGRCGCQAPFHLPQSDATVPGITTPGPAPRHPPPGGVMPETVLELPSHNSMRGAMQAGVMLREGMLPEALPGGMLPEVTLPDIFSLPECMLPESMLVDPVGQQMDDALSLFVRWSRAVKSYLHARGQWAEAIDPCSGYPLGDGRGCPIEDAAGVVDVADAGGVLDGADVGVMNARCGVGGGGLLVPNGTRQGASLDVRQSRVLDDDGYDHGHNNNDKDDDDDDASINTHPYDGVDLQPSRGRRTPNRAPGKQGGQPGGITPDPRIDDDVSVVSHGAIRTGSGIISPGPAGNYPLARRYSEVDAAERLLGFSTLDQGPCKLALHPVTGARVYLASMFTTAPPEVAAAAAAHARELLAPAVSCVQFFPPVPLLASVNDAPSPPVSLSSACACMACACYGGEGTVSQQQPSRHLERCEHNSLGAPSLSPSTDRQPSRVPARFDDLSLGNAGGDVRGSGSLYHVGAGGHGAQMSRHQHHDYHHHYHHHGGHVNDEHDAIEGGVGVTWHGAIGPHGRHGGGGRGYKNSMTWDGSRDCGQAAADKPTHYGPSRGSPASDDGWDGDTSLGEGAGCPCDMAWPLSVISRTLHPSAAAGSDASITMRVLGQRVEAGISMAPEDEEEETEEDEEERENRLATGFATMAQTEERLAMGERSLAVGGRGSRKEAYVRESLSERAFTKRSGPVPDGGEGCGRSSCAGVYRGDSQRGWNWRAPAPAASRPLGAPAARGGCRNYDPRTHAVACSDRCAGSACTCPGHADRYSSDATVGAMAGPRLILDDITCATPAGWPVVSHLSFVVEAGCGLLVVGPSGAGKSTLLQALAGVHPLLTGAVLLEPWACARVAGHGLGEMPLFLPQRPLMAPLGLAGQLLYPLEASACAPVAGVHAFSGLRGGAMDSAAMNSNPTGHLTRSRPSNLYQPAHGLSFHGINRPRHDDESIRPRCSNRCDGCKNASSKCRHRSGGGRPCGGSLGVPGGRDAGDGYSNGDLLCAGNRGPRAKSGLDAELSQLLEEVGLSYLLERAGYDWEAPLDWSRQLSQGEQQRLAMARVLFHRPWLAVCDEATSALDTHQEERMYRAMLRRGMSWITVSHRRETLERWHSHVLTLPGDGSGAWTIRSI